MLKFKMAALKPEILITQLIYKIHAKFQRLPPCFQGPGIQRNYSLYCMMQSGVKNLRWRLTNRNTYISACTQRNCKIQTAIYKFPFYTNSMKLFFIYCVMQAKVRNPRWRLTKTWYIHFSACTKHISPILTILPMY